MEITVPQSQPNDDIFSLRPHNFSELIGQDKIKQNLLIFINSAKIRNEVLDHTLLYGPPGLGKTTIAHIIASEMQTNIKSTAGPVLSKPADLAAILTNLQKHDVLFIDEIHRLNINLEEILYSAMEDFVLDIIIGDGPSARIMKINLPKFTLVGATTRLGLLSNALKDRFGIPLRMDYYSIEELTKIIEYGAKMMSIQVDYSGAIEIARRSRGTPRITLRLLRRVRDFAINNNQTKINKDIANFALNELEIDTSGLDNNDYRYLRFIADNYDGGPVGVETIAAALSEQRDAIEDTIEPFLIQIGFVQRTPRGRVLSWNAHQYLKNIKR